MTKKITIKDVAKTAGVSSATVSYVLNGIDKVSHVTKMRVLEVVEELGYYPDFTAISLSKKKSNLIGVILPLFNDSPLSVFKNNQYYDEFLSGVEAVSRLRNFDTMITGVSSPKECKNWIKKRNLDGLIFIGMFPKQLYLELENLDIPIVLIDTYEKYTKLFNNVQVNDELGGYLAANHLIEQGHRDIAFVATDLQRSPVDAIRFQGFKKALQQSGLKVNRDIIFEANDITFEIGLQVGREILNKRKALTGIVTVSDVLAIGIIKAIHQQHKHVPNDYSVVGFDDLSISKYITPSLTTIKQDIFEKGRSAADVLINSIESSHAVHKTIELPVELIVRESTKKL